MGQLLCLPWFGCEVPGERDETEFCRCSFVEESRLDLFLFWLVRLAPILLWFSISEKLIILFVIIVG